ncbi:hypothetical protein Tco_0715727 [Tanacetum coccineum]
MSNVESAGESNEISTSNFFNYYESEPTTKTSILRPNDDEEGTNDRDGSVYQPGVIPYESGHDDQHSATPLGEENNFEGNVSSNLEGYVHVFQNDLHVQTEEVNPKRSQRHSKLLVKLNEYVLDSKDVNKINVMNDEMHALYENDTWFMTDLPVGRKPIGCK